MCSTSVPVVAVVPKQGRYGPPPSFFSSRLHLLRLRIVSSTHLRNDWAWREEEEEEGEEEEEEEEEGEKEGEKEEEEEEEVFSSSLLSFFPATVCLH